MAVVRYAIWKYVGRYAVTEKSPMPMIADSAMPAAIVRSAKSRRGTIGSGTRSSITKNAAKPMRGDREGDHGGERGGRDRRST